MWRLTGQLLLFNECSREVEQLFFTVTLPEDGIIKPGEYPLIYIQSSVENCRNCNEPTVYLRPPKPPPPLPQSFLAPAVALLGFPPLALECAPAPAFAPRKLFLPPPSATVLTLGDRLSAGPLLLRPFPCLRAASGLAFLPIPGSLVLEGRRY